MPKRERSEPCPPSRQERAMRMSEEAAQKQLRAQPRYARILAYGDSLTSGYVPCEQCCKKERAGCKKCQRTPWADVLRQSLDIDVVAWGCEGWTTSMHVSAMDKDGERQCGLRSLLAKAQRDGKPYSVVLIMSGSNDLADEVLEPARIVQNLADLHRAAHAFGARTVALGIPASRGWAELPQLGQRGSAVNLELCHLPWREGNRSGESLFVEAPLWHTEDSSFYASDGLHLTADGYEEFGTRLAKNEALIEFVLPGGTVAH